MMWGKKYLDKLIYKLHKNTVVSKEILSKPFPFLSLLLSRLHPLLDLVMISIFKMTDYVKQVNVLLVPKVMA